MNGGLGGGNAVSAFLDLVFLPSPACFNRQLPPEGAIILQRPQWDAMVLRPTSGQAV